MAGKTTLRLRLRVCVSHAASGQKPVLGKSAVPAAEQPVPQDVLLKDQDEFRLIGKQAPQSPERQRKVKFLH
ncbi:MAG: hypothetical protein AAES65_19485 [Candidatus Thiodiazotropha sp. (ex. Lucinoma kazani)]